MSSRTYRSLEEVEAASREYDALVAGSDRSGILGTSSRASIQPTSWPSRIAPVEQALWIEHAGDQRSDDPGGVRASTRKIAYAPSVGSFSVEEPARREEMLQLVRDFDRLSLREEVNADQLREQTGRSVFTAMDPTLLVEDWMRFVKPRPSPPRYVVVYSLNQNPRMARKLASWPKVNRRLAERSGIARLPRPRVASEPRMMPPLSGVG